MNRTAILHLAGTGAIGAGILVSDQLVTLGLFVLGGVLLVVGILIARRNSSAGPAADLGD